MTEYFERVPAFKSRLWEDVTGLLPHLDIELTERCNNNCIHCWNNLPAGDESAMSRELSTDEWKRILTEAAGLGCLEVRFTGGEPLLREDFEELYIFTRHLGIKVLLSTNARLITARLAELFSRIPPLIEIDISAYGMKPDSYEAVSRVAGSFAGFRRGIERLLERNIPFEVSGALLPPNRSEMEEFEAWASHIPWMQGPPLYSMFFDLRKRRDSPKKNRRIARLRISPEEALTVRRRRPARERRTWMEFCARNMSPGDDRLFRCGASRGGSVDPYGTYQACMSLSAPEWTCDLHSVSLRSALDSLRRRILYARAENPEYLKRCARCFIRSLCSQCPAKSWIETGSLDTPVEYLCAVAHAEAYDSGLIRGNEKAWDVRDWQDRAASLLQSTITGDTQNGGNKKVVQT